MLFTSPSNQKHTTHEPRTQSDAYSTGQLVLQALLSCCETIRCSMYASQHVCKPACMQASKHSKRIISQQNRNTGKWQEPPHACAALPQLYVGLMLASVEHLWCLHNACRLACLVCKESTLQHGLQPLSSMTPQRQAPQPRSHSCASCPVLCCSSSYCLNDTHTMLTTCSPQPYFLVSACLSIKGARCW
jgi:hypothetical protein